VMICRYMARPLLNLNGDFLIHGHGRPNKVFFKQCNHAASFVIFLEYLKSCQLLFTLSIANVSILFCRYHALLYDNDVILPNKAMRTRKIRERITW
jgi:hypothetical protein